MIVNLYAKKEFKYDIVWRLMSRYRIPRSEQGELQNRLIGSMATKIKTATTTAKIKLQYLERKPHQP